MSVNKCVRLLRGNTFLIVPEIHYDFATHPLELFAHVADNEENTMPRLEFLTSKKSICFWQNMLLLGVLCLWPSFATGQTLDPQSSSTAATGHFAVSLDAGAAIPHGSFSNFFNTGFSFNAGLETIFTPHFSAEAKFGYHRFGASFGDDLNLYQFTGGGKAYLLAPPHRLRPFIEGGIGAYKFDSGATKFGGHIGGGVLYEFTPHFGIQARYNHHGVNVPGSVTRFSTLQGGARFRF
jgi:hypothetical protein